MLARKVEIFNDPEAPDACRNSPIIGYRSSLADVECRSLWVADMLVSALTSRECASVTIGVSTLLGMLVK